MKTHQSHNVITNADGGGGSGDGDSGLVGGAFKGMGGGIQDSQQMEAIFSVFFKSLAYFASVVPHPTPSTSVRLEP